MTVQYFGNQQVSKQLFYQQLVDNPPSIISIDTETISLKEKIPIGFAIATSPHDAWWFDSYPESDLEIQTLTSLLTNPSIKKVYANAMFDIRVQPLIFQDFQVDESNIADVLVMARILGHTNARVADLAAEVGMSAQDAKDLLTEYGKQSMLDLPHEVTSSKCANDAMVTLALYHHLAPQVEQLEGLSPDYLDVESKVMPILIDMSQRGLAIDQEARAAMEKRIEEERAYYKGLCEEHDFNPGSGMQSGYILAKRGNFLPFTAGKKQLKTDEETLELLDDPLAAVVLGYKRANSLLTKYLYPLRDKDRIYTEYGLDTEVGRTKSSDFNMQNIPAATSRIGIDCRHIFLPDSGCFTTGDFCLAPETRVLTADLQWKTLDNIEIGDKLIGIDESPTSPGKGHRRRLRVANVEDCNYVTRHAFMVIMEDGRVIVSSGEHPWLAKKDTIYSWVATQDLKPGYRIKQLVTPWDTPKQDFELGYLAGSFDSEGWVDCSSGATVVGIAQKECEQFTVIEELLRDRLGLSLYTNECDPGKYYDYKKTNLRNLKQLKICSQEDCIRFLGIVRPKRLLDKYLAKGLFGREPGHKHCDATVKLVLDLEEEQCFVSIQTSTKTFIAEGLFTHNSQLHLRFLAHMSGDTEMKAVYEEGKDGGDIHVSTMKKIHKPRSIAKIINYAIPYGGDPHTLSKQLHSRDMNYCSGLIDDWFDAYPDAAEWIREARRYAVRHGKALPTLFGRQIAVPEEWTKYGKLNTSSMERKGANYPILGSEGEVMKRALIICDNYKLPLAVQVHDSISCDGDVVFPIEALESLAPCRIPFEVDKSERWK